MISFNAKIRSRNLNSFLPAEEDSEEE